MTYPEKGAEYRHKPAWLDRAVEGEKTNNTPFKQRAAGGPASQADQDYANLLQDIHGLSGDEKDVGSLGGPTRLNDSIRR